MPVFGPVTPSLVSLADVHAHLNIPVSDTSHDTELQGFIDAAAAIVTYQTGPITPTSFVETYYPRGSRIVLDNPPVISVESVTEYLSGQTINVLTSQPLGATVNNFGGTGDTWTVGPVVRRRSGGG